MANQTKRILVVTLFLIGLFNMEAQNQKVVSSVLEEVTVFFTGAELTHTSKVNLSAGENEALVEGLSPHVDINSIKVKTTGQVVVSSFEFSVNHLSAASEPSTQVKALTETLEKYIKEKQQLEIDIRINRTLSEQLQLGVKKRVTGPDEGIGIDELMKTMDYLKSKSYEQETERVALGERLEKLQENINRVQSQLQQERANLNKTSGVLRLTLLAEKAEATNLSIIYFTQQAGWTPSYDIQVADTDAPVLIRLRANVRQTTGFDWERVKPTLSSGRPGNGKVAPLFSAWFLREQMVSEPRMGKNLMNSVQNRFSYKEESIAIEELIDADYVESPTVEDYVVTTENTLDVHYAINLPYSIPSNGKVQYIDLQNYEVKADYKYYVTPKLDKQTYVLAEIAGWEQLGLLSGPANINFNGTYLGETYLDTSLPLEKQTLTLGTDPRIVVKREKIQDYTSRRAIGSDLVQQFSYRITVKNNRTHAVQMVVKDQYPLSTQRNIEVNLQKKETTAWTANNEELGVISWEETFKPGETKVYQISYSVKYPKDMKLNL